MKVVSFDEDAFSLDHPMGTMSFNYLLTEDQPGSLENFRYILGRQEADFFMPRHRHAFEQIRMPLTGDMNLGEQGTLRQGEIGYFPEGRTYGPQDDRLADPPQLQLALQFGGASGLGVSIGRGAGTGETERAQAGPQKLPKSRYDNAIKFDPRRFNFLPVSGQPGVEHKFFGAFTERAFWIERIKIAPGAQWVSDHAKARRLAVVLSGKGTAHAVQATRWTAIQAEGGEKLTVAAITEMELHVVGLPPVQLPAAPEDYDTVISVGPIEFEQTREPKNT